MTPSFDEICIDATAVREHYRGHERWLANPAGDAMRSHREAAANFRYVGITFAVDGATPDDASAQSAGGERLIPFDLISRVIPARI